MSLQISNWNSASPNERQHLLRRPALSRDPELPKKVRAVIDAVRSGGDTEVRRLTSEFDHVDVASARVTQDEISAACASLTSEQIIAIDVAIGNVRKFHQAQYPSSIEVETMPGVFCERVSHPIEVVGLYVPAGTAPLPSAAVMLGVPAAIAKCPTRVMCTPPRPDGLADPAVLVAATRSGVDTIFKIGGAQAIAAMAYGTESIPAVDKIFGPGNAFVTEAKTQVAADPGGAAIDMPAGPSEVLVIADGAASAEFVASDLLSQAEHGPDSQVILVTESEDLAGAVTRAVESQLRALPRQEIARASIDNSRVITVNDVATAIQVSNSYAPEHLILHLDSARDLLPHLRNAGSVFLGQWSPESAGDYCSGTNHVLPTYGAARTYSGLSVDQFMRQTTIQEISEAGLKRISSTIIALAELEGLDGHARAVQCRIARMEK